MYFLMHFLIVNFYDSVVSRIPDLCGFVTAVCLLGMLFSSADAASSVKPSQI